MFRAKTIRPALTDLQTVALMDEWRGNQGICAGIAAAHAERTGGKRFLRNPALIVFLLSLGLGGFGGCADKPGGRFYTEPGPVSDDKTNSPTAFHLDDPGQTKAVVTIDANGNRAIMGSMHTQTSEATGTKLSEANTGGAPQQRAIMTIGDIKAMLSTAADFDWSDIDATFDDGKLKHLKVGKLSTSTSTVVKAVNEGIIAEVQSWINGTNADKEVQIKRLDVQAQGVGAVADVAKGALKLIETLKSVTPAGVIP